jgi:hypothetical protein
MSFRRSDLKAITKTVVSTARDVKRVYTTLPKEAPGGDISVLVRIPDSDESSVTMPRPLGRKKVEYDVHLIVVTVDTKKNTSDGEQAFEDAVDAIIEAIRANPQPDERVLAFGVERIRSHIDDPREVGDKESALYRRADITFPVVVHVTG